MNKTYDVAILGSGVVAHTLALLLARTSLRVALQQQRPAAAAAGPDIRAYALNQASAFFHAMAPAFAAAECLAALVAARRGRETLAALEASEQQLAAFDTYVLPRAKGRRRK